MKLSTQLLILLIAITGLITIISGDAATGVLFMIWAQLIYNGADK